MEYQQLTAEQVRLMRDPTQKRNCRDCPWAWGLDLPQLASSLLPPSRDISPAKIPEAILIFLIYLAPKVLKVQTSKEQAFPRIEYFSEYLHLR